MKATRFLVATAAAAALAGCAITPAPLVGVFYTDISYPRQVWHGTAQSKVGEACASSILGLVATGDASIEEAKKEGRISKVTSVDQKSTSILGLFGTYCTVVTGE